MLVKEISFFDELFPAYKYQKEFMELFLEDNEIRNYLLCWHRRAGKDFMFFNLAWLYASMEKGSYLYTLPKIAQAKNVVFEGTTIEGVRWLDLIPTHLLSRPPNITERKIYFTSGSILTITGADSIIGSHLGTNIRGIYISEFQRTDPRVFDYLRPIIKRNPKGFFCMNYTAFGQCLPHRLMMENEDNPQWYTQKLTVDDTRDNDGNYIFSPEQVEDERRSGMEEDIINQEYYCDHSVAVKGTYFSAELQKAREEGRIVKDLEIYPRLPVHTSWDLGSRDANSIWFFQVIGTGEAQQFRYFYEHSENYKDIPYYIELLHKIKNEFGFSGYGTHFLPHDSLQTEWSSGKTRRMLMREQGLNITPVPRLKVIERVQVARTNLHRCWFKEDTCRHGLLSLEASRSKYDEKLKAFSSEELHDWASHCSASFQYGHVGWLESYNKPKLQQQRTLAKFRPLS